MNKKNIFFTLGVIALIVSAAMYFIGTNNSRLTELKDMFWIPLPIAAAFLLAAGLSKNKA